MAIDSDTLYTACSLPFNTKTIRVFHMEPGDEGDQIQGSLRHLALDTEPPPQYECVSYVWGNPESAKTATINQKYIILQKNLYDALRHIRSKTRTVIIWADAICINQSDINEKSYQVAMMAEIYRKCSKVHIWLGLAEHGGLTGDPFAFLEHFLRGRHYYGLPGFHRDSSTGRWTWKENEACSSILNDFLQVVESPWWTRAWTVQECLLPRDILFMFGAWTITWDDILDAWRRRNTHTDDECCKGAINVFTPHQLSSINEWMWHPGRRQRYWDVIYGHRPPRWFYQAILAFSSRDRLDPRDKIYSMLSLATHASYQGFGPNYQEDVPTVYIDIFTRMVQETNGNFTCFMGGGFGSSMPGLPSWVRDFSQVRPLAVVAVEERRIQCYTLYQASVAGPLQPLCNDNRELHYVSTYAETVKAVGLHSADDTVFREYFGSWLGTCDPRVLRITFLRIICGDVCKTLDGDSDFRRAKETDLPEDAWDRLMDGDISVLDARAYGSGLNFGVRGRCLFTTYSGKMGLCHPNTLPGDEVWVLCGIRVPFVVRPLKPSDAGCAGRYSFLGDCFLHGTMDGELGFKEMSMLRPIILI